MNFGSIDEILEFAIEREKEAVTFYNDLSKLEKITSLKNTFKDLAQEEAKHVKLLTGISKNQVVIDSYEVKEVTDLKVSAADTEADAAEGEDGGDVPVDGGGD